MSLAAMNDHVRALVDHGEEFILIQNIKRNILGHRKVMSWRGKRDADLIAVTNPIAGLARLAVDLNAVRFDNSLNDRAATIRKHGRQILIETEPFHFILGRELDDLRAGRKRRHGSGQWFVASG